jgi:hypothetical protein
MRCGEASGTGARWLCHSSSLPAAPPAQTLSCKEPHPSVQPPFPSFTQQRLSARTHSLKHTLSRSIPLTLGDTQRGTAQSGHNALGRPTCEQYHSSLASRRCCPRRPAHAAACHAARVARRHRLLYPQEVLRSGQDITPSATSLGRIPRASTRLSGATPGRYSRTHIQDPSRAAMARLLVTGACPTPAPSPSAP